MIMSSRSHNSEEINVEPILRTRRECLESMLNKSAYMDILHCPPDWDHYSYMCWGPTPAGKTAKLPCPDDGYLNPEEFATRKCLSDGRWYINYTFDDKPYTKFDDCFLTPDPSAEADLKKLVDTKIIFILKSMDEYEGAYIILHIISLLLLVASFILSVAAVFKLKQNNYSTFSYIALSVAAAALFINNVVTVSISAVDDATKVRKCRGAKSLALFTTLIFYEFLLGYMFMTIVPVLRIVINPFRIKSLTFATVILTIVLVICELSSETLSYSTKYCGFKTMESTFHWFTTFPKLMLIMILLCVGSVITIGVLCLRHPHVDKSGELCHIRQKAISTLSLAVYNVILEILLVLIHAEAYMGYTDLPMEEYVNAFSFVTAAQGFVFSMFMCFSDLKLVAMIGLAINCPLLQNSTKDCEVNAFEMNPVSILPNTSGTMRELEHHTVSRTRTLSVENGVADLIDQTEKPEDPENNLDESKLFVGFLK